LDIGLYGDFTKSHAATYSLLNGAWTELPDISGMQFNYGTGINDLGVAVGVAGVGNLNAFSCSVSWIWDPSKDAYSFFTVPGAASACPYGINDRGQVVGGANDAGFLKDGELYTFFDVPGAASTGAGWINNEGVIVGVWYDSSSTAHGYVRNPDGLFTIVDVPGSPGSAVYGNNDRGDICGFYLDLSGVSHGYVGLKR